MTDKLIEQGNNAVQNVAPTTQVFGSDVVNAPKGATINTPNSAYNVSTQNSTTPPVLTPAQAFNNNPIPVATITSPDTSGSLVAGAKSTSQTLDQTISSLTPQESPLDKQQQGLLNDISNLTGQDSGKSQALLDAQGASGATQANADLTALNNKLKIKTAEYDQLQANLGGNGSVETSAVLAAQNASLTKARAADLGIITAQIQAKQGDLRLALDTAQQAVDARYSTIEDNIKTKLAQLEALRPSLDAQQKVQALAQQKLLQDQQQKLADEKAQATSNTQLALTAGVSTKFVNKNGQFFDTNTGKPFTNPQDFFAAAGVSSFEEAYQKGLITDLNNAKLQDINFAQQAQAKYPDVKIPQNASPEEVQKIIQNSKIYRKETYIAPPAGTSLLAQQGGQSITNDVQAILEGRNTMYNIRQTMGRTNQASAYMQKVRDEITKIDPNFDFVASDAGGKSVSTAYVQKATASINSVLPNIDKIVDLSNQVSRVGIKGVDSLIQKGQVQINNQKVANFREAQKLISDEIGVALGAGTVSDMKLQLGFDVTDPSVSQEIFASNMGIVKDFIENRKQGLEGLRYQSSTVDNKLGSFNNDPLGLFK